MPVFKNNSYITTCLLVYYNDFGWLLQSTSIDAQVNSKVIHRKKKLFWNVSQNCNLVSEFNGLVSKGVNQQDWPFLLLYTSQLVDHIYFHFIISSFIKDKRYFIFYWNYFLIKQDADVDENLTLFYE